MLELVNALKTFITNLDLFALVDIYRNELASGSQWNPVYPVCFIRFESLQSLGKFADASSIDEEATVILYIAQRFDPAYDSISALELTDQTFQALQGFTHEDFTVSQNSVTFIESGYGVDIYQINLTAR